SPLAEITKDQPHSLGKRLNEVQDEYEFSVNFGLKHIAPFIEGAGEEMAKDGIKEAASIVLAPHNSTFSSKSYNGRVKEECEKQSITITSVESWYKEPKFINYWSEAIKDIFTKMPQEERKASCLIVSAHSLPEKI